MRKGFTLLELLLVIAILAILAAAIGPEFTRSAKSSLESARKERFKNNYSSCLLAANMYLLASDTTNLIRNGSVYQTVGFAAAAGGLKLLTASQTLILDATQYENNDGSLRYFSMAVGPNQAPGAGQASCSTRIALTPAGTTFLSSDPVLETDLKTKTLADIWEAIKNQ